MSLTSGDAAFEALPDLVFGQVAANEDDPAVALFVRTPRALVIAIEDHVHALKNETLGVVLEQQICPCSAGYWDRLWRRDPESRERTCRD